MSSKAYKNVYNIERYLPGGLGCPTAFLLSLSRFQWLSILVNHRSLRTIAWRRVSACIYTRDHVNFLYIFLSYLLASRFDITFY